MTAEEAIAKLDAMYQDRRQYAIKTMQGFMPKDGLYPGERLHSNEIGRHEVDWLDLIEIGFLEVRATNEEGLAGEKYPFMLIAADADHETNAEVGADQPATDADDTIDHVRIDPDGRRYVRVEKYEKDINAILKCIAPRRMARRL